MYGHQKGVESNARHMFISPFVFCFQSNEGLAIEVKIGCWDERGEGGGSGAALWPWLRGDQAPRLGAQRRVRQEGCVGRRHQYVMSVMRKFSIRSTSLPMSWELYIQLCSTSRDRTVAGTAYWVHLLGNYIFEILFVGKLKKVSSLIFLYIPKTFDIFLFADLGSVLFLYTR